MATKKYTPFDWYNIGEPATPFLALSFRGNDAFLYTFPSKQNRIYVENASVSVLDDNGYSTASITLADPDFVNLEVIFLKALYLANSLTIGEGNWFCSVLWGWSSYGMELDGSTKTSGRHYYMLKNLTYDLTDVELRVSIDLMDIGHSSFGTSDQGSPKIVVGLLNKDPSVSIQDQNGKTQEITKELLAAVAAYLNQIAQADQVAITATASGGTENPDIDVNATGAGPNTGTEGASTENVYYNILQNPTTYWQAIQIICKAQGINAIARPGEAPPEPTDAIPVEDPLKVPMNAGFKEEIEELLTHIAPNTATNKKWSILPGGRVTPGQTTIDMIFGWVPLPPKGSDDLKVEDNYRLARTFVYRPAYKQEIARGETMINSLRYTWTSRGYMAIGLPPIFAIAPDKNGKMTVYTSAEQYSQNRDPRKSALLQVQPDLKPYTMEELQQLKGVEVSFNFDTRTMTEDEIETRAGAIIINVWNLFLKELIDITIEIPGDPWLDNTFFLDDKDYRKNDILVDMYNAYFKVKVYKPGVAVSRQTADLNPILTGNYLCLKGCTHNISEGEYTTTLTLMKSF